MRYALLLWVVAGCAVDHAGLGSSEPPVSPSDAALLDGTPSDVALRDATLRDVSSGCDGATRPGCNECPLGFETNGAGECTNIDECEPNPCMNGGSCSDGVDAFRCACPPSFMGATCESVAVDCDPNPCMNGGTCADIPEGIFCSCPSGFTGDTCETDIDGCTPNPCMNGGSCTEGIGSFSCRCSVEFDGETCSIAVPESELAFYDPIGSQVPSNPLPVTTSDPRIIASQFENMTFGTGSGTNNNRRPVLMTMGALDPATTFYVTVTLAPVGTDLIALSRITYDYASYRSGATGTISVRTSADGFAATVDSVAWTGATRDLVSFDMRSVPPSADPMELRLYMHDLLTVGGPSGDWADLVSTSSTGDGMRVFGRAVAE
jgi:hypothetical protein